MSNKVTNFSMCDMACVPITIFLVSRGSLATCQICYSGIMSSKNNFITSIMYVQIVHPDPWKVTIFEIECVLSYHKICAEG